MPEQQRDPRVRTEKVPRILLRAGVALVPLAVLTLLFGATVVSVLLALVAVASVGGSLLLRPEPERLRGEMEEVLFGEIDLLRDEVRENVAASTRATQRTAEERVRALQQTVEALRAELAALRSEMASASAPPAAGGVAPAGFPVPPGVAAPPVPPVGAGPVYGPAGRTPVSAAIVEHTETVRQVTTRRFVGQPVDDGVYPGAYAGGPPAGPADWGAPVPRPRRSPRVEEDEEESWTDRVLQERYGRPATGSEIPPSRGRRRRDEGGDHPSGRYGGDRFDGGRHASDRYDHDDPYPPERHVEGRHRDDRYPDRYDDRYDDDPYPPDRYGGRYGRRDAPARDGWRARGEGRAEELRMGERRAAVRADAGGTELHVEDRWAAVRREWSDDRGGHPGAAPALPPAPDRAGWDDGWDQPDRARRDDGYDHPPRRPAYERPDDWR